MTKLMLVGLGRWGAHHLRHLRAMSLELYVAEKNGKQLELARKLGLPETQLTQDYRRFLARVDGVVVVTPAPTHFALCRKCLQSGKDVFVEKPISLDSTEARELAGLADRTRRILQVGHILRFDSGTEWLREAIRRGQFGRVQILRSIFCGFKRPRTDSGILFADAIHIVDLFNYLLGQTPARVGAVTQDFMGRGMEDASWISLEYNTAAGVTWGTIETNYFLPGKLREVSVLGTELSAICDYGAPGRKIKTFANRHVKEGNEFRAVEGALGEVESASDEPLLAELRAFVDSVQTRRPPRADGWSAYDSVRVLEAAMESARRGHAMELNCAAKHAPRPTS